ncbi:putative MFS family arabinose efflux permease [Asanoa ferruginea]|uniref:Putative MFS family arabinose efflux permease n=1 Tax=Asanoa ferruginea TaxID=53367 RepID=A0A3D9ZZ21_9ACTN|nr:MFS transporter [Asanoa ferruginea]REG02270.1 putative MFS family arabinose efflux permease [Asanoa ferruginea]GIF46507.1 MFS transporter [Asanoa ferruginea]
MAYPISARFAVLRLRDFRIFVAGHATSTLGTQMAGVALVFAVLDSGGSPATLSYVLAARIVPMVLVLPLAGVLGDRLPRRFVMLSADCLRAAAQAAIAVLFFAGTPDLWLLLTLAALSGLGEATFRPSFDGLVPQLVPADRRHEANTFVGLIQSIATVAGPALAAVLVVATSPATVLLIDAITYVPSILALLWLRVPDPPRAGHTSMLREMREGWRVFAALPWLWTITLQFTLFNLLLWAPYLVLGPISANRFYGGAAAWGAISAVYGAGAILGGVVMLAWKPTRPLLVATAATILWASPSAALAAQAPLALVCAGALLAGIVGTLWMTTIHQRVPTEAMSRVNSYVVFGSFSVGPIGLALAGPAATATSIPTILLIGVAWQIISASLLLALPAIHRVRRTESATEAAPGEARPAHSGATA